MCKTSKNVSDLYEQILGSELPYYFMQKRAIKNTWTSDLTPGPRSDSDSDSRIYCDVWIANIRMTVPTICATTKWHEDRTHLRKHDRHELYADRNHVV